MSQTLSAVSGESKNIADDQWLEQLRVNLTTTLRKDEIAILAKQLGLNDQQVVDIKTFNTLVRQANQSNNEEGMVGNLKDRSGGKYQSSPDQIAKFKSKSDESQSHLKDFVPILRKDLGDRESDFAKWVQDQDFIKSEERLFEETNRDASAEDMAQDVMAKIKKQGLESNSKDISEYEKWIHDRAFYKAHDYILGRSEVRGDKGLLDRLNKERLNIYKQMLSSQ